MFASSRIILVCAIGFWINACDDQLEIQVDQGALDSFYDTCIDNCPVVLSVRPVVGFPGDEMRVFGENLQVTSRLILGKDFVEPNDVEKGSFSFIVPEGAPGEIVIETLVGDKITAGASFFRMPKDYPVFEADPEDVCIGERFYNLQGELIDGEKDCSRAVYEVCSEEGDSSCILDEGGCATFLSAEDLSSRVVEGKLVAGVEGRFKLPSSSQILSTAFFGVDNDARKGSLAACADNGDDNCYIPSYVQNSQSLKA